MARSNALGKLRELAEAEGDPRKTILKAVGAIDDEIVFHEQVLVAIRPGSAYHPGTKILRTDRDLQETQFQGSVGLVLKVGPGAFKDIERVGPFFYGQSVGVGDWVLFRPSDGLQLYIREVPCRLFDDKNIKMKISQPEIYW